MNLHGNLMFNRLATRIYHGGKLDKTFYTVYQKTMLAGKPPSKFIANLKTRWLGKCALNRTIV